MRNTEAIRKILKGDIGIAQSYMGLARKFLGIWLNSVSVGDTGHWTKELTNGVIIEVGKHAGQKYVKITAGEEERFDIFGLGCLPATDLAPDGWGVPYTPDNRPLGTIGGTYPEVIIKPQSIDSEPPLENTRIFRATRSDHYLNSGFPNAEEYNENTLLYANIDWRGDRRDRVLTYAGPRSRYFPEFRLTQTNQTLPSGTPLVQAYCHDTVKDNFGLRISYSDGGAWAPSFQSDNDAWKKNFELEESIQFGTTIRFRGPRDDWFGTGPDTEFEVRYDLYVNDLYEENIYRDGVKYPTIAKVMGAAIYVNEDNEEFLNYITFDYDDNKLLVYRRSFIDDLTKDVIVHEEDYDEDLGHIYPWFFNPTGTEARSFRFKKTTFTGQSIQHPERTIVQEYYQLQEISITIDPEGRILYTIVDSAVQERLPAVDWDGEKWSYLRYEGITGHPRWDDGEPMFPTGERDGIDNYCFFKTGTLQANSFISELTRSFLIYYVDIRNRLSLFNISNLGFFTEIQDWEWVFDYNEVQTTILTRGPVSSLSVPGDTGWGQRSICQLIQTDLSFLFQTGTWWTFQPDVQTLNGAGNYPNPFFSVILPYDKKTLSITQAFEDYENKGTIWYYSLVEQNTDLVSDTKITGDNPRFYPANIL